MSGIQGLSLPANLSPAELGQAESILAQVQSGTISAAQGSAELASLTGTQSQPSSQGSGPQVTGAHQHREGHRHESQAGGNVAETLSSVLDLNADQQSQIESILKSAQANASSPADVRNEITAVLTPEQQQKLAALNSNPPVFSTTA